MIDTPRLTIRRFEPDDGADLLAYLSLEETYRFEPGHPVTENEARALADERSRSDQFWAVVRKDDHRMVGHLYFALQEPAAFRTYELGFIFHPAFQHRGYATEAARALVDHAFRNLGAHRITAGCHPDNGASWRLLERLGMRREGHFLQNVSFRNDAQGRPLWNDSYQYGILAEEVLGNRSRSSAGD